MQAKIADLGNALMIDKHTLEDSQSSPGNNILHATGGFGKITYVQHCIGYLFFWPLDAIFYS